MDRLTDCLNMTIVVDWDVKQHHSFVSFILAKAMCFYRFYTKIKENDIHVGIVS